MSELIKKMTAGIATEDTATLSLLREGGVSQAVGLPVASRVGLAVGEAQVVQGYLSLFPVFAYGVGMKKVVGWFPSYESACARAARFLRENEDCTDVRVLPPLSSGLWSQDTLSNPAAIAKCAVYQKSKAVRDESCGLVIMAKADNQGYRKPRTQEQINAAKARGEAKRAENARKKAASTLIPAGGK